MQGKKAYIRSLADLDDVFANSASVALGKDLLNIGSFLLYGILNILLLTLEKLGRIVIASAVAVIQIEQDDLMAAFAQCACNAGSACNGNVTLV